MAAETGRMKDARGRTVAMAVDEDGGIGITVTPHSGHHGRIAIATPGQQDDFARLYLAACTEAERRRPAAAARSAPRDAASGLDPFAIPANRIGGDR